MIYLDRQFTFFANGNSFVDGFDQLFAFSANVADVNAAVTAGNLSHLRDLLGF